MNETKTSADNSNRLAGYAGFVFLFAVLAENVLRGGPVAPDSPVSDILKYYQEKQSLLVITHSLYIFTIPSLLLYASGLYRHLTSPASDLWARTGLSAAGILVLSFALVVITDMVLAAMAASGDEGTHMIQMLFKLHAAAFSVNGAVLGTAMIGYGMAARLTKRFANWLSVLAIGGGSLLILSAIPADAVMGGSPIGMLGLAGFLCWLVWLVASALKLIKG